MYSDLFKRQVARLLGKLGYTVLKTPTLEELNAHLQTQKAQLDKVRIDKQELTQSLLAEQTANNAQHRAERERFGKKQAALWHILERTAHADYYFAMDVVGTCTLRCPSCPVGNSVKQLPTGLMSVEMYQQILDKIVREHPGERVFIDLFNWGESALHKNLPDMIRLANEREIGIGLSTNLNSFPRMREVIRAKPSYIRISLSGFNNDVYQQTHAGGDINLVKANMHLLRHHMDETGIEIPIQVGFHVYRTNFPEDFSAMRKLCDELSYYFMPSVATFMPLEKALYIDDPKIITDQDRALLAKLVVPMDERTKILSANRTMTQDCEFRSRRTAINFDGSVALCCATFSNDQLISRNYVTTSREELHKRKYEHQFCTDCMNKSFDMIFTGVDSHLVENRAAEILGPQYSEFLEDKRTPWN
jgi:MoaA/NifB/PqqE/SkfB family radical SAM enzyme